MSEKNVTWHESKVTRTDRMRLNGHKSFVVWFTGLSASGKSTLSVELEKVLHMRKHLTYILDGDNIRHGLNRNLGFSEADRIENIRRVGEVSKLMVDAGVVTLSAFISPYRNDREMIKELFEAGDFIEVYVKCSLEECEKRDPKGLYKKAREGLIPDFTGISAPYEHPLNPHITIDTEQLSIEAAVGHIVQFLEENEYL
ncbi:adenylyl-sulfate kinase [Paenibacillus curdlanolyticus]|uniref:adenylyl-sulfate kinase n=1 Tax=Paenibacillus curdlanolyticus TaxID=59840 RepID=UPI0002F9DC60|nr:adenylyl-sulfate kinase [Paenibacillus curdlanolyticus]